MKVKRFLSSAIAASSLFLAMGTAGAATTYEVNIYGASAQFNYWNAMAPKYLRDVKSCSTVQQAQTSDKKNAVTKGTSCGTAGDTYIIRVSSKASYDGVYAALQSQDTSTNRVKTCDVTGNAASYGKRPLVDETTCTSWQTVPTDGSAYTIPTTCTAPSASTCKQVMVGASDVEASSFSQASSGLLKGPAGGAQTDRSFNGDIDAGSLTVKSPIVVPFAFFVNNTVTKGGSTITNLSRMEALMIFSGQAYRWTDLGGNFVDQPITACLRHAGSGTHSTLDKAVMHDSWGAQLLQNENTDSDNGTIAYFNDGSSDMMTCINGQSYSVGYADADQSLTSYTNVSRLKYNGVSPSAFNIIYGNYDNFWSVQKAYYSAGLSSSQKTLVDSMMTFANNPDNLPSSMAQYYAAECELVYTKDKDDSYPMYRGSSCTVRTDGRTY